MLSDEALYERLLGGDLGAFDALYERYARRLFGFIRKHLPDAQEAEDVLHEAFMAVLREGKAGRAPGSLRAWLFQVARNLCHNRLRSERRTARAIQTVKHTSVADGDHPERALQDLQATEALRQAVERLPTALAELYELRAGGMSYEELARVLDVPLGTVKSRMHQMVSRLREEIER